MQMIEWKIKGLYKADAETVYREITEIGEEVTPEEIVEKARNENTELHKCFEWHDRVAAEKYRIQQAQSIVRNIAHTVEYRDASGDEKTVTVRAILCTNQRDNKYETIQRCIENPDSFARLKATMLRDLEQFKRRYEKYSAIRAEFAELFEIIEAIAV